MSPRPLLLSMGEPAGICSEITLAAWQARRLEHLPVFALVGDPRLLSATSDVPIVEISSPAEAARREDTILDAEKAAKVATDMRSSLFF